MNKIHPNPKIHIYSGMPTNLISRLRQAVKDATGLEYGYIPHKLHDTSVSLFTMTLCNNKSKNISWKRLSHVETAIRACCLGLGVGMVNVTWDVIN